PTGSPSPSPTYTQTPTASQSATFSATFSASPTFTASPTPGAAPTVVSVTQSGIGVEGGFVITVTGTNFLPGSVIYVDGVALATTYINATTLTAVALPHAAGTVAVTVANPGGIFAGSPGSIHYDAAAGDL